jgi:hypothetical protein
MPICLASTSTTWTARARSSGSHRMPRGGEAVKTAYRQVTESMIRLFEANLSGPEAREQALVFVALCVGGMVLARGIDDRALGDELRKSAERHILAMTAWEDGQRH